MSLVVSEDSGVEILTDFLNRILTLCLFANDHDPDPSDTISDYTEVAGGGYAEIPLTFAHWDITTGDPSQAIYDMFTDFNFTGPVGGANEVFGYFVKDASNELKWAERIVVTDPFEPQSGALIRLKPKLSSGQLA